VYQEAGRADWRAEYHEHAADALPRVLRLARTGPDGFNLRLGLSQVELNEPLDDAAFEISVPAGAQPVTLEELRTGAVLSEVSDGAPDGR
jgi:hypothetical protein